MLQLGCYFPAAVEPAVLTRAFLDAFDRDDAMPAFASDFRLAGDVHGAPALVFGVPGATAAELATRGMTITFDDMLQGPDGHVVVWGISTRDGAGLEVYHVVLTVEDGAFVEARFFNEIEQARWYAGL